MKLTEKAIEALNCQPGQKDRLVFDDVLPGLGVRVSAKGNKAFIAQYTVAGGKRRVPLGRWGAITLDQARTAARIVLGNVAKGADPAREKVAARAESKAVAKAEKLTLKALVQEWEKLALSIRRKSYRNEAVRALHVAYAEHLGRPAADLTRERALVVLDRLVKAGSEPMAGRTLAYGRACYRWALRRGMVATNPFEGLPIAASTVSRDRVLTEDEVALIWKHSGTLGAPFDALFQILLLTAQRRAEVGAMRWSELSADRTIWTIPKERAKNGKAHIVHLAPTVRTTLAAVKRVGRSTLVFTTTGTTPASGFTKAKLRLDATIAADRGSGDKPRPLAPWRLHDFRRTAVTWMAENGIAPHVADRLLNHVTGSIQGVAAVYQRAEFLVERKAAIEAWAGFVTGVIAGE